jgi:uncharacterized membrane protein
VTPSQEAACAAPARARQQRLQWLDALRGAAVVWMVGFHFCFDLRYFRFTAQDFYNDPFWTTQRTLIVTLFLFCAGLGQAVAHAQGQGWRRFWKRWSQVAGCAALVSLGSWWVFGPRYISFGVLHAVALMLLLLRGALHFWPGLSQGRGPWLLAAAGLLCLAAPLFFNHPFFDTRMTNWIGLMTHRPATEDHVPLLPWIGVMLLGLAAGLGWVMRRGEVPMTVRGTASRPVNLLAVLGRWSLSVYMLHQPVFFGLLTAWAWWLRR